MCANNSNPVLVSISCITYNHAPFIRECLDGFIMQKTNFSFEVLIHDDASTDGTTEIIKEYEEKYPDIIKPLYEEENQWIKGRRGSAVFNFPRAKGKYIALCEGDDYWTDPLKLQKQVDFLEANPDFVMCTHDFLVYNDDSRTYNKFYEGDSEIQYDLEFYLSRKLWVSQPLTVMFRKLALDIEKYLKYEKSKDLTLFYCLLKEGKGILLKDNMGVYRIHEGGIWQGVTRITRIKADLETTLAIYNVDKDLSSAKLVRSSMLVYDYMGISFLKRYFLLYIKCIYAIYSKLGISCALNTLKRTANYFVR